MYGYVCLYIHIYRPGRRLGPPNVWNLALSSLATATMASQPRRQLATTLAATCPSHLFLGVRACRLPALKPFKRFKRFEATCPSHLFLRTFEAAVCPPSNPANASNPSAGLSKATGNNSRSHMPQPSAF